MQNEVNDFPGNWRRIEFPENRLKSVFRERRRKLLHCKGSVRWGGRVGGD